MKTIRTIIVSSALLISAAHANLIDLTPGGFNIDHGLPPAFHRLQTHIFFDEAAHGYFDTPSGTQYYDGWVSQYGAPNGYWLSTVDVFGRRADGTPWENIYGGRWGERFLNLEDQIVTLDGITTIMGISFYGLNTVPDEANTGTLLLVAVSAIAILLTYEAQRRRNA